MVYATASSVLRAIATACSCSADKIESALEELNDAAGLAARPIVRKQLGEERLDVIRAWLGTPEAASVIERAQEYVRAART